MALATYERDSKGRLLPGHPPLPGAGRKPRAVEESHLADFSQFLASQEVQEALAASMIRGIKKGDAQIMKLALEYQFGKPVQSVDMNSDSNIRIMVVHELVAGAVVPLLDDGEEGGV